MKGEAIGEEGRERGEGVKGEEDGRGRAPLLFSRLITGRKEVNLIIVTPTAQQRCLLQTSWLCCRP